MNTTIKIPGDIYKLLQARAEEMQMTPDQVAETIIRLQLGNMVHIEQRATPSGPQAYLRGTRVAVRHIAAFLMAGHSAEEIAGVVKIFNLQFSTFNCDIHKGELSQAKGQLCQRIVIFLVDHVIIVINLTLWIILIQYKHRVYSKHLAAGSA